MFNQNRELGIENKKRLMDPIRGAQSEPRRLSASDSDQLLSLLNR